MKCFADSCIWIDFAKGKDSKEVTYFEEMLKNNLLYTSGLIKAEIVPFIRDRAIQDKIETIFRILPYLFDYAELWDDVVSHQKKLLKEGLTGSIPDLIIASLSIHYEVPLLTRDTFFFRVAKVLELQLIIS